MNKILSLLVVMALGTGVTASGGSIPVLLRIPVADQPDTLGCNFVSEMTRMVYSLVLENKVKLWDSRSKDIQITGTTLTELERASRTEFTRPEVMYLYENWERTGAGINTQTIGFMFVNKNALGEEVSYGYVDFNDLKTFLLGFDVALNPNADDGLSLAYFLYKKRFYYNILQYGGKAITTGAESRQIRQEEIGDAEFNPAVRAPDTEVRKVRYVVDALRNPEDESGRTGNALLAALEGHLQANEEIFYNLGGDRIMNFISRKKKIRVTRLEVNETWKKKNGLVTTETDSLVVVVNDSALQSVPFSEFLRWGIFLGDQSMYEVFRDKKFTLFVTRINATAIQRKESYLYYKALMTEDWGRLTEYVKRF